MGKPKSPPPPQRRYMEFVEATDVLFSKIKPADMALYLGTREAMIVHARVKRESRCWRAPPPAWQGAAIQAAQARIAELQAFVEDLRFSEAIDRVRLLRPDLGIDEAAGYLANPAALAALLKGAQR